MEKRFIRNIPAISEAEQQLLRSKSAVILGCGGLGGYIAELLCRSGVGKISLVDGDRFEESNLNRQLYALPENLGQSKAEIAAQRLHAIDPKTEIKIFDCFFTEENAPEILEGADLVMDALDSVESRLLLERLCAERGLYIVHGAVEGWSIQCGICPPGAGVLQRLYGEGREEGGKSVTAPVVALCAAMQSARALLFLCGRAGEEEGKLSLGDARGMDFVKIEF